MASKDMEVVIPIGGAGPVPQYDEVIVEAPVTEEFSIITEGEVEPVEDPAVVALKAQIADMQARVGNNDAVSSGFQELSRTLGEMRNAPAAAAPQAQAPIDIEARRQSIKDKWFDDPLTAMEERDNLYLGPVIQQLMSQIGETASATGKQNVMQNPKYADVFEAYGAEVEQVAKGLPATIDRYQQAVDRVKLTHIDELFERRLQAEVAKQLSAVVPAGPAVLPTHTGVTRPSPVPTGNRERKLVMSAEQKATEERFLATNRHIDRGAYFRHLADSGKYRVV